MRGGTGVSLLDERSEKAHPGDPNRATLRLTELAEKALGKIRAAHEQPRTGRASGWERYIGPTAGRLTRLDLSKKDLALHDLSLANAMNTSVNKPPKTARVTISYVRGCMRRP